MLTSPSISQKLAQFFCTLRYEDLPDTLVYQIKTFFLDWLASAFAGLSQPPTQIMLSLAKDMKGSLEATIIPTNGRHLSLVASLVNGASSHVREMDDLHRQSIFHPAASVLPAVFAAGENAHVSGRDLILGILTGYETGIRAALAAGKSHYEHWHTTATCGTFGAAAGAAKVLGLEMEPFVWALGSAGTQSSGLWEFLTEGAMSKQLHPGKSSMNGLLAALLAQKGFTGSSRIFEGEKGFLRATSEDYDFNILTDGLGENFHTAQNSLKYYASCGHTHSSIEAALKAWKDIELSITAIRSITVYLYQGALDLLEKVEARTPYLGKFNISFCVATALYFGHVDLDDFTDERLKKPEILRLMSIISLKDDPEFTRLYPKKWPSRVQIELENGKRYEGYCEYPKGDPENPLSEKELIEKFKKLCENIIKDDEKERIIDSVLNLEKIDDVATIFHG
ncbi:MAG: MmgE/PrpD family protein [Desulfobacteraceae bacterium]|nr:MAG: MmgE/PrpD family protein [Desulfobacteraceae bacterium]